MSRLNAVAVLALALVAMGSAGCNQGDTGKRSMKSKPANYQSARRALTSYDNSWIYDFPTLEDKAYVFQLHGRTSTLYSSLSGQFALIGRMEFQSSFADDPVTPGNHNTRIKFSYARADYVTPMEAWDYAFCHTEFKSPDDEDPVNSSLLSGYATLTCDNVVFAGSPATEPADIQLPTRFLVRDVMFGSPPNPMKLEFYTTHGVTNGSSSSINGELVAGVARLLDGATSNDIFHGSYGFPSNARLTPNDGIYSLLLGLDADGDTNPAPFDATPQYGKVTDPNAFMLDSYYLVDSDGTGMFWMGSGVYPDTDKATWFHGKFVITSNGTYFSYLSQDLGDVFWADAWEFRAYP